MWKQKRTWYRGGTSLWSTICWQAKALRFILWNRGTNRSKRDQGAHIPLYIYKGWWWDLKIYVQHPFSKLEELPQRYGWILRLPWIHPSTFTKVFIIINKLNTNQHNTIKFNIPKSINNNQSKRGARYISQYKKTFTNVTTVRSLMFCRTLASSHESCNDTDRGAWEAFVQRYEETI